MRIETDRRYRATIVGLLLLMAGAASYFLLAPRRVDPDTPWHLATGRYIVEHLAVPRTDPFSWYGIEHHLTWMPQAWLFDVGAYTVWRVGGFALLYLVTAAVTAATVGLVYRLFALRSGRPLLAVAVAALAVWGLLPSIAPRPQAATYLLLLVLALLLERRRWWWAVPIVLLGVNLHGPVYPLYLAVVAYYALPRRWPVLAACAGMTLLTPAGISLLPYPFAGLLGTSSATIQEFLPVAPISWPAYLVGLVLLFLLLDRRSMPARDMVALVLVIALSLTALRQMVFLFVLALPIAAPYLRLPSDTPAEKPPPPRESRSATAVVGALDIALVAVLGLASLALGVSAIRAPVVPFDDYPVEAAQYLRAHHITRYMNEWSDGGYLLLIGMRPMVDGRGEPFFSYPGRRHVTIGDEYMSAFTLKSDIRPLIARNKVTHVLLNRESPLARVLEQSDSFRVVYRDARFAIYQFAEKP